MYLDVLGVEISSPPNTKSLDFSDPSKVNFSVTDRGISLELRDPGVAMDWFDTDGLVIRMNNYILDLPKRIDVRIDQEGFYMTKTIEAKWSDPNERAGPHQSGPHQVSLSPEIVNKLGKRQVHR